MPRFVVLRHEKEAGAHYDLMFEQGSVLWTFSFGVFPRPGVACEQIADHRLEYLEFEGDIGEGKGVVAREDAGSYDLLCVSPDLVCVFLRGERLKGNLRIARQSECAWRMEGE